MPDVDLEINGVVHRIGCAEGEETRLRVLAGMVDRHAQSLTQEVGVFSESKLYLMTALMIADELADANDRIVSLEAGGSSALYQSDAVRVEPADLASTSDAEVMEQTDGRSSRRAADQEAAKETDPESDQPTDRATDGQTDKATEASFARVMLRAADRLDALAERLESA